MTKILLIMSSILVIFSFSKAQDSVSPSSPSLLDASTASLYQNLVIQSAASKLMTVPLPEDLQIKLGQVLIASEAGFSLCDLVSVGVSSPPTIFNKKSKKCALKQFKVVITQLALIEQEAILRNATLSTTTTTTTTTPVPTTVAPTTPSTTTTTTTTTTPVPTTLAPTTPSTTTTTTPAPTTTEPTTSSTTTTATIPASTTTITPPPTILPKTTKLASDDLL